jgi:addiction module HigA family antidote
MKSLRNPNRRPTHPGAILREDVLPALKMTQTEMAQRLGVSRLSVSELLHEKRSMTPEMSMRVAKLLNTTPESWLRMQEAVDLWEVQQKPEKLAGIKPIRPRRVTHRKTRPIKRFAISVPHQTITAATCSAILVSSG